MTNGGRHRTLRTRMARSNPRRAQYQREVTGSGGQEVPKRTETDGQVEDPGEGSGPDVGPYPLGVRVRTARLREHASAEVHARQPSLAHGCQDPHARPAAATHVQSRAERAQ